MTRGLVLPVRFRLGRLAMDTVACDMVKGALLVRCVSPVPAGARVTLTVSLPAAPPVTVGGIVRGAEGAGDGGMVMSVEIVGAHARLLEALESMADARRPHPSAPPVKGDPAGATAAPDRTAGSPTKKAVEAVPLPSASARLRIRFPSAHAVAAAFAGGDADRAFLPSKNPTPAGTLVLLVLELPDLGPPATCDARIVRTVSEEEALASKTRAGAEILLLNADAQLRRRIDDLRASR